MQGYYKKPTLTVRPLSAEDVMQAASRLDETKGEQTISVSNEEYNDEFSARHVKSVWDD